VTVHISLKGHQFQPAEPQAPAGKPITIILKNLDPTPAEFESNMLRVEKVVVGGGTITMWIRPLRPGRYRFFDDFHNQTQGFLIVKSCAALEQERQQRRHLGAVARIGLAEGVGHEALFLAHLDHDAHEEEHQRNQCAPAADDDGGAEQRQQQAGRSDGAPARKARCG
jgi:Cupredoxin-like domain